MVTQEPTILLLDFAPETNAGDYAIQRGLLELMDPYRPSVRLVVSVTLGANQMDRLIAEFPRLLAEADVKTVPAVRPTYFNDRNGIARLAAEAANALSLVVGSVWLMVARRWQGAARRVLRRRYRATFDEIIRADLIVWRGKNLRGRPNRLVELYRIYTRLFMPLVCHALGKKVVCTGMSVWRVRGRWAQRLVRSALGQCVFIGLREANSLENVQQLVGGDSRTVEVAADLSLVWLAFEPTKPPAQPDGDHVIALTLMDWSEFGRETRDRYVDSIAHYVEAVVGSHDLGVRIIPQVTKASESTAGITRRLLDSLTEETRRSVTVVEGVASPEDLLDEYRRADLLVATRMHSAVFALAVGTPVIVIEYDVGPKWSVLADLGLSELVIRYDEVTAEALLSRHQLVRESGREIMAAARAAAAEGKRSLTGSQLMDHVGALAVHQHRRPNSERGKGSEEPGS